MGPIPFSLIMASQILSRRLTLFGFQPALPLGLLEAHQDKIELLPVK